jgi:hypothetical protein
MATRYQGIVDFVWTDDGDFSVTSDVVPGQPTTTGGDFRDTKKMKYRGWLQRVQTRLESSKLDWQYLGVGANLDTFKGARNSRATGEAIKLRILNELTKDDLVRANEIKIDVMPLSTSQVGVMIMITPPGSGEQIIFTYSFSLKDTQTIPREV